VHTHARTQSLTKWRPVRNLIDDYLRRQQAVIAERGWIWVNVMPRPGDPEPPFAYTVGLTEHRQPELLVAGLDPRAAHALLARLAERVVHDREQLRHLQHVTVPGYTEMIIIDGTAAGDLQPNIAVALYGAEPVRLQQVVWPDPHGRFPWEPHYELSPADQLLTLSEN
jgi:hypothetical protein